MKARNNASDEGEKKEGKKEGITEERKEWMKNERLF
jgi:hypothetical protein